MHVALSEIQKPMDMQKSLPRQQALPLFVSEQRTWPIAASPFSQ